MLAPLSPLDAYRFETLEPFFILTEREALEAA